MTVDREKLDATFLSFMESVGQLCQENMNLREVLRFYASEENWESREVRGCCEDHNDYLEPETDKDLGARAREALKEIE